MTGATPSMRASSNASWAGALPRRSKAVSARRSSGTLTIPNGWHMCRAAPTVTGCRPSMRMRPQHENPASRQERPGGMGTAAQPGAAGGARCAGPPQPGLLR